METPKTAPHNKVSSETGIRARGGGKTAQASSFAAEQGGKWRRLDEVLPEVLSKMKEGKK